MRLSLGISVCVHVVVLAALIFLFRAVPAMRLPEGVYSVKILQPFIGSAPAGGTAGEKASEAKKQVEAKTESAGESTKEKPLGVSVGVGTNSGTGIAVDAADFPFGYFLAAIERKVSENWFSAVAERASGLTCVVYFKLMRDGSISEARLETSSGNTYFDRAALRAVRSATPFPPLPRSFPDAFLGIHFTFVQKE
jgi:TolA protein